MALFSNRLTCCLHSRRLWKAVTVAACVRHHSSLIAELIENMDKKATWDRFYTENASATPAAFKNFEWFFGFDSVRSFILPALQSLQSQSTGTGTTSLLRVLDLGCGTSAVGPSIYRHSPVPVHVTCADISPVAVALMQQQQHAQQAPEPQNPRSRLDFLELDCAELHGRFGPRSLDLIVDKGTVDSLLRSREGSGKAGRVLGQCLRALRSSGSLLQFSDEDPDARLPWLETEARGGQGGEEEEEGGLAATVTVHDVGELRGVCYYCYQVVPRPRGV